MLAVGVGVGDTLFRLLSPRVLNDELDTPLKADLTYLA